MRTKAKPVFAGSAASSFLAASRPPAEAPSPTMRKLSRADGETCCGVAATGLFKFAGRSVLAGRRDLSGRAGLLRGALLRGFFAPLDRGVLGISPSIRGGKPRLESGLNAESVQYFPSLSRYRTNVY